MVEYESTVSSEEPAAVTYEIDEQTPPSIATAMAVADLRDVDPTEVPCLYEYVDPEAIDALLTSLSMETATSFSLEFELETTTIHVDGTGTVTARLTEATPVESTAANDVSVTSKGNE